MLKRLQIYNTLNQLWKDFGAAGTAGVTTVFGYDDNSNRTSVTDPLGRLTTTAYDELNRVAQNADPNNGITKMSFDVNDDIVSVIDPRILTTTYGYGGLAQLNSENSPDTAGTTNTYDSAGNISTSTDARGAVSYFTYDALNRPIGKVVSSGPLGSGGTIDDTISFVYDITSVPNGVGRLYGVGDSVVGLVWNYDAQGRVIQKKQTFANAARNVGYMYANGDLATMTTPSGQIVAYTYTNHRVTNITINGTPLLSQVSYTPFGAVSGWQWASGLTTTRTYDTDGRIQAIASAGQTSYAYYGDGTLETVTSDSPAVFTTATVGTSITPSTGSNQLSSISGGISRSYSYDSAGHVSNDGTHTFIYNDAGRLITATTAGVTTTYTYNAFGQRVRKVSPSGTVYFVYDEAAHLIGEYDGNDNLIEELVWMGDIPVASIRPSQSGGIGVFYIHTDQINAPTRLTRANDNVVVWRWDHDAYGNGAAMEDPDANGANVSFNLRLPGQYFDAETGLSYNYQRDYDPTVGRYLESDPLGLSGAGYSTYAYANGNPVSNIDPLGLWSFSFGAYAGVGGAIVFGYDETTGELFYGGRLGVGLDIGWNLDPLGRRPGSEQTKCDGPGTTYGTFESLAVNLGPIAYPLLEYGNGIDEPSGTIYTPEPELGGTASGGSGDKPIEIGGAIGFQVIGHTKW